MAKRARPRRTYHRNWRTAQVANSERGAVLARDEGCEAVDNDFHLTKHGQDWGNEHGAPSRFWFAKGDRMEKHASAEVFAMRRIVKGREYRIRTLREALTDNQHHGLDTEIEVKDVRPWALPVILNPRMAEIAWVAREVYGPDWHKHVVVKVLTDLGGGVRYALKICRFAHAHDVPTMLLVRGRARFRRFRAHPEVTYIRGSLRRLP